MDMEKNISGVQKAAILMMALGEENCSRLFEQMHEEEIRSFFSNGSAVLYHQISWKKYVMNSAKV